MKTQLKITICIVIFLLGGVAILLGAETSSSPVALLVSLKIRPYVEALEGVKSVLSDNDDRDIHVYYLQNYTGKTRTVFIEKLKQSSPGLIVSIGPEAMRFACRNFSENRIPLLYSMVLNPLEVAGGAAAPLCGIPLNIPWREQIRQFSGIFKGDGPVGILYNPLNNDRLAKQAVQEGQRQNVHILPLKVYSPQSIQAVLNSNLNALRALWLIPDQTVTSESLIRYIIKTALSHGVGVIGFNRFFYENGAALSFILDYEAIGRQTGEMAQKILTRRGCEEQMPVFRTWLNHRVIERLGLSVNEAAAEALKGEGP